MAKVKRLIEVYNQDTQQTTFRVETDKGEVRELDTHMKGVHHVAEVGDLFVAALDLALTKRKNQQRIERIKHGK